MKSKVVMASLLAILMVVTVVPMTFSEDSEALIGDSNLSLNAQHVNLYMASPTQNSFNFVVDMSGCTSGATSVEWSVNEIGSPQAAVQFTNETGTSVTVTGTAAGTIEILAYADDDNYASAVVVVQAGYAPATSFTFKIQVDPAVSSYYNGNIIVPSNTSIAALNAGITLTVTKAQVEARYGVGTTFNAMNALTCAMGAQNDIIDQTVTNPNDRVYWQYNISQYGWINTFLGLGTYPGPSGSWIYWAQYHAEEQGGSTVWAFNNYGLYDITTEDYSEMGLIFWASPANMGVPNYPFITPTP